MNRRERRARRARLRSAPAGHLVHGYRWKQVTDPDDARFVRIEMRIYTVGMPDAEYEGADAMDRLDRFCNSYLAGTAAARAEMTKPEELD